MSCAGLTFGGSLGRNRLRGSAFFVARCEVCGMGELQSPATRVWSQGESGLGPSLGVAGFMCKFLANSPHERWHKKSQGPLLWFFPGAPEGFLFRVANGLEWRGTWPKCVCRALECVCITGLAWVPSRGECTSSGRLCISLGWGSCLLDWRAARLSRQRQMTGHAGGCKSSLQGPTGSVWARRARGPVVPHTMRPLTGQARGEQV